MKIVAWQKILSKVNGSFKISRGLTSFVNPYSMLLLEEHPDVVDTVDSWHVDGISLVNTINKNFGKNLRRLSFDDTSLAPQFFNFAKINKLKIALIGTHEVFIQKAAANIEKKYNVKIEYFRNGYFQDDAEKTETFKLIIEKDIALVVCGMGTPYQERFLMGLRDMGWNGCGVTCGGYFHQIAQKENYYPYFFNRFNIRWIYRIIDEPKLFKRYFIDYPRFYLRFYFFRKQSMEIK